MLVSAFENPTLRYLANWLSHFVIENNKNEKPEKQMLRGIDNKIKCQRWAAMMHLIPNSGH